ncbi:MAG TPA: hypothetical protein VFE05_18455 [Longimicrobiaceae bacterium]|jgi:hypothetical protein|nr:hypothetical protein [Longimicrobiaceae bacterium]
MRSTAASRNGKAILAATALAALAACSDRTQAPVGPLDGGVQAAPAVATSGYSAVVGDDWKAYQTKDQLKAAGLFWWVDSANRNVYDYVDLVQDPTFGQVVRITFPANTGSSGSSPRIAKDLPAPMDKMWYRWRMKFQPGWTTVGPDPSGWANSYKIAFWTWQGYAGRGEIEYSNTSEYITGNGVNDGATGASLSYKETLMPGSAANFGVTSQEWSDGQWYEFVVYYEKTGATTANQYFWRRKLTTNGAINPNPWIFHGYAMSGNTTPQVAHVELGINKNKNNPTTMYLYWGQWEVVDGAKYPNPFGMPNVSGSAPAPSPATATKVTVSPKTVSLAPSGTAQFSATAQMSDGTTQAASVTWTATAGTVASTGAYTAPASAGTYKVVGTAANGMADTATVTVAAQSATVTKVTLAPKGSSVQSGKTLQFSATATMSDGTSQPASVAYNATGGTISGAGLYTAGAAAGTFRVIATATNGVADTASVNVTAAPAATLTAVVLNPPTASVQAGGTVQFTTSGTYSDGTSKAVAATYSATGGTITTAGLYTAGQTGGTFRVISVAQGSTLADTSTVTVSSPAATRPTLTRVVLNPPSASVQGGGTVQFSATGTYSDGSSKAVTATYSATGGTITTAGLYTAGQTAGTFRVIAVGQGSTLADTSAVTVTASTTSAPPSTGAYAKVAGDDWRSYAAGSSLQPTGYFGTSAATYANVSLVSDPTFGQVARVTQNAGTTTAPVLNKKLPAALDRMWFRFRMKLSPGWNAGSGWTLARWTWSGYGGSGSLDFENGAGYANNWSAKDAGNQYIRYTENLLPGSTAFGTASAELTSGDWYEYVVYWQKTGATTGRQHFWKRRLTSGGTTVNNAFTYYGYTEDGSTTPQAAAVQLGANLLKAPAATQYVYWGPWEVVNGATYANPFGMSGF